MHTLFEIRKNTLIKIWRKGGVNFKVSFGQKIYVPWSVPVVGSCQPWPWNSLFTWLADGLHLIISFFVYYLEKCFVEDIRTFLLWRRFPHLEISHSEQRYAILRRPLKRCGVLFTSAQLLGTSGWNLEDPQNQIVQKFTKCVQSTDARPYSKFTVSPTFSEQTCSHRHVDVMYQ